MRAVATQVIRAFANARAMQAVATQVIRDFALVSCKCKDHSSRCNASDSGFCECKGHTSRYNASDSGFCEADGFGIDAVVIYGSVVI